MYTQLNSNHKHRHENSYVWVQKYWNFSDFYIKKSFIPFFLGSIYTRFHIYLYGYNTSLLLYINVIICGAKNKRRNQNNSVEMIRMIWGFYYATHADSDFPSLSSFNVSLNLGSTHMIYCTPLNQTKRVEWQNFREKKKV